MAAVLCVGVLGTGTTFAMLTNQTGTIKNYFTVATVETQIEEELDERLAELREQEKIVLFFCGLYRTYVLI